MYTSPLWVRLSGLVVTMLMIVAACSDSSSSDGARGCFDDPELDAVTFDGDPMTFAGTELTLPTTRSSSQNRSSRLSKPRLGSR
jgi:hypothetical protein